MKGFIIAIFSLLLQLNVIISTIGGFILGGILGGFGGSMFGGPSFNMTTAIVGAIIAFANAAIVSGAGLTLDRIRELLEEQQSHRYSSMAGNTQSRTTLTTARENVKVPPVMTDKVDSASSRAVATQRTSPSVFAVSGEEKLFLNLWSQGLTITEIAAQMNISEDRLIRLQSDLKQRFGVYSNADLVQRVKERGYLSSD